MAERKIAPVKDNDDKARTYKENMKKYNRAIKSGCYFEAILIAYAMMEDRLRSYLFYLGCLRSRSSHKFDNKKISADIKDIIATYAVDDVCNLGITSITGKIRIVKSIQKWFKQGYPNLQESDYLEELASCIDMNGDPDEMLTILAAIEEWCKYRNEVIHSLLNKNLDSLYTELPQKAEEGIALARAIDKHVGRIKRRNTVRKYLKLKES